MYRLDLHWLQCITTARKDLVPQFKLLDTRSISDDPHYDAIRRMIGKSADWKQPLWWLAEAIAGF
jgi:hypothetical protein